MSKEIANAAAQTDPAPVTLAGPRANPFERQQAEHINAGTVAIESERAVAEAQGALVIAQRFPRNPARAYERVIQACQRPGLAESAFYSFPRGGEKVSGPTIRLAEELARCWGNIAFGMRELSNRDGVSEIEAYAWDLETNTKSVQVFTVRHIRDTRGGGRELTDQRDIYELGANMGARRLRARILAILPDDLVSSAVEECKRTLARGGGESMPDRLRRVINVFGRRGVSVAMLEAYMGHEMDMTTPEELADLHGIFQSIKDGNTKVSDWFGASAGNFAAPSTGQQGGHTGNANAPAPADPAPAATPRRGRPAKSAAPAPADVPANDSASAPAQSENQEGFHPAAAPLVNGQGTPADVPAGDAGHDAENPAPLSAPGGVDLF